MKKLMIMAMMTVMTVSANAMSYEAARNEALFLSDKMAYELDLTEAQYEAVYEINLDYLLSIDGHADVFGVWWERRNADLRYVLTSWQYDRYMGLVHFYRPVSWVAGAWAFAIYTIYDRALFYHPRPTVFVTYRGGNNHRDSRFYANRYFGRPAVHHGNPTAHHHGNTSAHHGNPTAHHHGNTTAHHGNPTTHHHNDNTGINNGNTATHHGNGQIAQNGNSHHGGSTHSGSTHSNSTHSSSSHGGFTHGGSTHSSSNHAGSAHGGSGHSSSGRFNVRR